MTHAALAAPIAFGVTATLTPLITRFCRHAQILDRPGRLKIHSRPVPRLGGVAIFLAVLAGTLISNAWEDTKDCYFYSALTLIWLVGLLDDVRGLPAILRLVAQLGAALLIWIGGWRLPGLPHAIDSLAVECCLVVLFVNAINWWDGMDGLAAGTACVSAVCYALLPPAALSPLGFAVALSLAGACAGFLLFNWHPRAYVFLGDSGSYVIGFLIAYLGLDFSKAHSSLRGSLLFVLAVAALPVLDAARVIAYRIAGRRSALQGDRSHFYDLMLKCGCGPNRVAIFSWSVAALCGGLAVLIERTASSELWLLALLLVSGLWLVASAALLRKSASNCRASDLA